MQIRIVTITIIDIPDDTGNFSGAAPQPSPTPKTLLSRLLDEALKHHTATLPKEGNHVTFIP